MNCAQNLELSAFFFPNRPAVREARAETTYAQLNDQANRIATGLMKLGLNPGELVGLCTPNSGDWIAFYFGVLKTGAVALTLSGVLTGNELRNLVSHSRPRFIFTIGDKLNDLERLRGAGGLEKVICPGGDLDLQHLMAMGTGSFKAVDRDRADTAAILYTGGTTGTPKGVMVPHEAISFSSHSIAYYERSTENDVGICFLPFNHVFGQMHIMNSTILTAGCLELLPAFDMEQALSLMETGRITKFFAVPTVYVRFLSIDNLESRIGKLRYSFSAAASMAVEIVKQWKERTGLTIAESYGMTEAMPLTYNHYYRHVVGSVGQMVHGVEIQIRDKAGSLVEQGKEGEICVRGRNVMKGYLNDPEGTRAAFWEGGWLRTGDIGLFDDGGYLYIVDRLKDLIITGGENVYPREVEEVLYTRNEVEGCAVVGVPDKEWGERVTAFIAPKPGQNVVPEELKSFLKTRLSPFKVPKEYIILSELPKSPAGKILKRELKKRFIDGNK
ncbi:MAG TPA: AMP-binding protein [Thermodesulfobacteriota bacterium]|nr:AMP-binding protein [Thermodesulfobacteriota bacterium]